MSDETVVIPTAGKTIKLAGFKEAVLRALLGTEDFNAVVEASNGLIQKADEAGVELKELDAAPAPVAVQDQVEVAAAAAEEATYVGDLTLEEFDKLMVRYFEGVQPAAASTKSMTDAMVAIVKSLGDVNTTLKSFDARFKDLEEGSAPRVGHKAHEDDGNVVGSVPAHQQSMAASLPLFWMTGQVPGTADGSK